MNTNTQNLDIPDLYTMSQIDSSQETLTTEQLQELSQNEKENKKPLLLWLKKSTFSLTKGVRKKNLHVLVRVDDNVPSPLDLNDTDKIKSVNTSLLSISKRIIDSKEYSKILSHDASTLAYVKNVALPGTNKKNLYMIDLAEALNVQNWLDTRIKEREELVKKFAVDNYDNIIQAMSVKLGPLFSYSDYPDSKKIQNSFTFIYKFFSFDVPISLRDVSLSLYKKEQERSEQYWNKLRNSIKSGLIAAYQGLIDNFIENLSPAKDGKKKKFSKKAVDKMVSFLENFNSKNSFTNFKELEDLVETSKQLLSGIDAEYLKKDAVLSQSLVNSFSKISEEMNKFTEIEEERFYFFDDEEKEQSVLNNVDNVVTENNNVYSDISEESSTSSQSIEE